MNWPQLLTELSSAGLSQMKIAEICASSQTTISDLKNARIKDPSFALGSALVELHRRVLMHGVDSVLAKPAEAQPQA